MTDRFIIAGAQRSGTTFLYEALDAHPGIAMARPMRPEPKFFLQERGPEDVAEYDRLHFSHAPSDAVRGEKSTTYLESPIAARSIANALPDARLVFVLRDPVERAISNVAFSARNGFETQPLETALSRELDGALAQPADTNVSASPFAYLARGRYADLLEPYFARFPARNIRVVVSETLWRDRSALAALTEWLGADPARLGPRAGAVNTADRDGLGEISPALRARLDDYFAASNARLEDAHGLDLSDWGRGK